MDVRRVFQADREATIAALALLLAAPVAADLPAGRGDVTPRPPRPRRKRVAA